MANRRASRLGAESRARRAELRRLRGERRRARSTVEAVATRAALEAAGGAVILLEGQGAPRVISGMAFARSLAEALGLGGDAGAADIVRALANRFPTRAPALHALERFGRACDFAIPTFDGGLSVAGRSAGALAWLRLSPEADRSAPIRAAPRRPSPAPGLETGLLDALADAVAIFDADRRLAWHNAAFAALWDLDPAWLAAGPGHGEWLDRLRRRRRLPETADYAAFKAGELARHQAAKPSEPILWRLPDERILRLASQPRAGGGLTLIFSDITREIGLTSRLNQLIQVQRAILDRLTDAVAVFGGDGRLTLHNEAFERFWGVSGAQLAEQPDFDGVVELCVARLHDLAFWRDLKGRITDADPALRAAAGGEILIGDGRWASWHSRPLPDGATLVGFADVSDARRLARALAEREGALAEAERLRKAFIANVSYELRIPLTTVLGYCDLIERGGRIADARDRAWLAAARAAGGQLAASIEDALTMAELDAGELALELEIVDIADLLAGAAAARTKAAASAGVQLRVNPIEANEGSMHGHGGSILADPGRLRQAIDHLIGNALRHTPAGGTIRLTADRADGEVRIAVADDGRGLPFDIQAHVFDRFGVHGPAGLGLPLVKALVELHGGWVSLESEPGAGSTFTCHLPEAASPSPNRPDLFPRAF